MLSPYRETITPLDKGVLRGYNRLGHVGRDFAS